MCPCTYVNIPYGHHGNGMLLACMYTRPVSSEMTTPSLALPLSELATRKYLDKYLASAFNLALEDGRLKAIDNHKYVLTLDYMLKVCVQGLYNY